MSFSLYSFARSCFWSLPTPLRDSLHGVRHALVRRFRAQPAIVEQRVADLDWSEFCNVALRGVSHRAIIIVEPCIDWEGTLFQRPQQMALALGCLGCLVIYKTNGDGLTGFRQMAENVWIAHDSAVNTIPNAVRIFYSTASLTKLKDFHAACRQGRVVYEYIDSIDESLFGEEGIIRHLHLLKQAAFNNADVIISSATVLYEEVLVHGKVRNCALVPNGVDVQHFRNVRSLAVYPEFLCDFRKNHKRVVGYFGAIAPWLWYEVIDQVSALMPDVGFVFIGLDYPGCAQKLPQRGNVIYIGTVNYAVLPVYAQLFDVCFIPFRPGDVARTTSPVKLFEYFALEKPVVVASDMNECVAFPEVFAGGDAIELTAAINQAFAVCGEESYCIKLRKLADANSWNVRAMAYLSALES